ncbi:MAG: D-alanyl-D-alanine carboxypeptidase [Candidatus Staskawiczbacteria bacterium]|nr:D-alanyl-D-alanine carboxypeptidase [Candidatus Staskawiczbacteria bacterium]
MNKIDIQPIVKNILLFVVFVFLIAMIIWILGWFFGSLYSFFEKKVTLNQQNFLAGLQKAPVLENLLPYRNWQVEDLKIDAESAISVETDLLVQKKVLFKKNETKVLPTASLVKLMTALVVLDNYNLQQQITITGEDILQEGEQGDLKAGQIFSVKNLLYMALIESSNDAAFAISSAIGQDNFVALMNIEAKNLGLLNTYFKDSSGLDAGSYSTAKDLVQLAEHLLNKYPLVWQIMGLKEYDLYLDNGQFHHKLINTNKLLGEIPEVLGGKTGFTNYAKGTFLVVQKSPNKDNYLMHVILGSEDRLEEMKKIINWINIAYNWQL